MFRLIATSPTALEANLTSTARSTLDNALLAGPGMDEIQIDLLLDYRINIEAYAAFHADFRELQPPFLAVWAKNDPFLPAGAEAFRRDLPKADIRFFETGHFALETHAAEIGAARRALLAGTERRSS